jgi:membrane protein DedA with SNARE-associated domain
MTETLLALVPTWGAWLVLAATLLSCLAIPAPSSLIMLAAGAFVSAGDLSFWAVVAAALGGALLGDQLGYFVGRFGGAPIWSRLADRASTAALAARAEASLKRHDLLAVYFSRWLFSPLGPYVNLLGGATAMNWARFTAADIAGEATWVALYVGLGMVFSTQIEAVSAALGNIAGALAAGLVTLLLARALWHAARENRG